MNILDIIFAVIAGYLVLRGLFRGLVVETASLAGAVVGFFLANSYAPALAPYTAKVLSTTAWAHTASYFAIFAATMILATLLAKAARRLLQIEFAAWLDHVAGGLVGLVKGALICSVILLVLANFFGERDFIMESQGARYLSVGAGYLQRFLPEQYRGGELEKRLSQLEELRERDHLWGDDDADESSSSKADQHEPEIRTYEGKGKGSGRTDRD
ncbi:MAG: CvpA family protein [Desulfovibrionaceae bacterium]|jgi:membrane protein required for colicin V production|nr:CvpA family protein [Desulfovibrionaceae bacterium]